MTTETLSVPLFPLPNVVFFPDTILPLHIFEPRYKEMVADALAGDRLVGIAHLRPGWESDYYGTPPVYKLLGVGEIIQSERWPNGRYDILLEGRYRAQIMKEQLHEGGYRVAQVEILREFLAPEDEEEVEADRARLLKIFHKLLLAMPEETRHAFREEVWTNPPPGTLADLMAHVFAENAYAKQSILSELNIARRLRLVQVQLRALLRTK